MTPLPPSRSLYITLGKFLFMFFNLKLLGKAFFSVMKYVGCIFFIPSLVAILFSEFLLSTYFFLLGFLVITISFIISKKIKEEKELNFSHALIVVALVWILVSVLGAIPFILSKISFINALFESVSAFTTTGFSVLDVSMLPKTLIFWRSFMQWVGGIGIVVAALAGIFKIGGGALFLAEAREERIRPNVINTVKEIWWIYLLYTTIGIGLLLFLGLPPLHAVAHAMAAISTGGMSSLSYGVEEVSNGTKIVLLFLMIIGATSFLTHYNLLRRQWSKIKKDSQFIFLLSIILIILFSTLFLGFSNSFNLISAITTTGFSASDISKSSEIMKFILILLMFIGGCTGSTAGGIKILRFIVFLKCIKWNMRKILSPHIVIAKRVSGRVLKDEEITTLLLFLLIYLLFVAVGVGIITGLGFKIDNALFDVVSAQSNVGLSVGVVSPTLHPIGKMTLIINMLLGRIELWALITLVLAPFIRR